MPDFGRELSDCLWEAVRLAFSEGVNVLLTHNNTDYDISPRDIIGSFCKDVKTKPGNLKKVTVEGAGIDDKL